MVTCYTIGELEEILGSNIKRLRLVKNLDRQTLAEQAGVSVTALRHLEGGSGATTKTLLKVLRTLGKANWIESLAPVPSINPLHMMRIKGPRQRASKKLKLNVD